LGTLIFSYWDNNTYLKDRDIEMHTFSIDLALETTKLVELEGSLSTVDGEEEPGGQNTRAHETETYLHEAIKESFHH